MMHFVRKLLIAALFLLLIGCGPEAGRQRGAGLGTGADVNNRSAEFAPASKVFTTTDTQP